jgi:hypothetical protein
MLSRKSKEESLVGWSSMLPFCSARLLLCYVTVRLDLTSSAGRSPCGFYPNLTDIVTRDLRLHVISPMTRHHCNDYAATMYNTRRFRAFEWPDNAAMYEARVLAASRLLLDLIHMRATNGRVRRHATSTHTLPMPLKSRRLDNDQKLHVAV